MGKGSKGKGQRSQADNQHQSPEELRNRVKDALEKANQLLAESGKNGVTQKPNEGDTKS